LSPPEGTDSVVGSALRALVAPWSFGRNSPRISTLEAALLAVLQILIAATLSTFLSTWTYLIGKGFVLGGREMDMGMDDLPIDTIRQVASSFALSLIVWTALLTLAVGVAACVADLLYRADRPGLLVVVRRTCVLTVWFIVWAAAVVAANSVRHREIRHPAAAVRAYAQLNQHWFRGSSASDPGPIEREPLVARGRLRALAAFFPIVWSLALPLPARSRKMSRVALIAAAIALSWIAWWGVWRLLPWIALETLAG
jgi:hypothetical protein